ncbi:Asp-tRNA(Asn)/Glu-tRNA(Gln) amidotransferase subunit GatB [Nitrososphaera sp.]|uniref:Asp-tRNA(Asn)/Glu-tRNA(Gln) amidotransferase subunit GatB n=1 Tax=Nitrososphaera sp. TaxID=1971748 RepID=UPI002ED8DC30
MEVKIGLEIHCQLTGLASKLFCPCPCNYRGSEPNANTCPVCLGLPGTLPLLNRRAVEFAGMITLALGCRIPEETMFYRKNYFYPDLPKNFQLTQYNAYGITSIGVDGKLDYDDKSARIRRVQLEEDPGRLVYEGGSMEKSLYVLVDYNRAGVPLVEIVTEPDFADPNDVRDFLNKVKSIVEHLGICDTNLEGAVRCDANVSVAGGNRVEIKNVNSFADVEKALKYEMTRQKTMVSRDIEVKAETRHWDDARKVTKESRSKEEEQDYRYFPEPDVPSVELGRDFTKTLQGSMPELPDARKARFESMGLSSHVASVLIDNKELADFFESAAKIRDSPKEIANWLVTDLMGFVDEKEKEAGRSILSGIKAGPAHIADLVKLVEDGTVNRATAKQILAQVVETGEMPSDVAKNSQVTRIGDTGALGQAVDAVFSAEPSAVADAKKNPAAVNFLLGKVMQQTKGRADPKAALELIRKKLEI